jgi:membrane associated rhomboid family serine protease
VIPLRDDIPSRTFPIMMYLILAACGLGFFYTMALPSLDIERFITAYGVIPAQFTGHAPAGPTSLPVRLLTSLFLHGGLLHLLGNMLFLWIFGDNVEDALGHVPFLFFYVICGVIANFAHIIANPLSAEPTIGASGAIAGVLGAYLILYPRARVQCVLWLWIFIRFVWVPAVWFLPVWIFIQLYSGLLSLGAHQGGGVAWWAHVGGFVSGIVLVRVFALMHERSAG